MSTEVRKAVILARGLGTRMRRRDPHTAVDAQQARVAETGMKGMIPIGRPFMDYLLSALADSGYREACLVIGPEHQAVRDYYDRELKPTRIRVDYAIQERPLGTADAVAAAEAFAGNERFLVVNSDNFYPPETLEELRKLDSAGLAGFERTSLVSQGNLALERVMQFPILQMNARGELVDLLEGPEPAASSKDAAETFVSMNCWLFSPRIFLACRAIQPSASGELEIPAAVRYATRVLQERFRVIPVRKGVLDLSTRGDIPAVAGLLAAREVRL
jgi:glucose-1-phosphate thymidylyltransferase